MASKLIGRARGPVERSLSAREIEMVALVARGVSNKLIAKDLRISEAIVKTHLLHIFAKLGVDDRTAAEPRRWRRACAPGQVKPGLLRLHPDEIPGLPPLGEIDHLPVPVVPEHLAIPRSARQESTSRVSASRVSSLRPLSCPVRTFPLRRIS